MNKSKIVFLDRDGTIIVDKGYMHRPEDLEFHVDAISALRIIQNKYKMVIVSNQSGIGRGMFHEGDYATFDEALSRALHDNGVCIEASLHCPHSPDDNCYCRKPRTGLVSDWMKSHDLELDLHSSYVIGDKISDIEFAQNLGIKGILIARGESPNGVGYDVVRSLYEAAETILC